jgi:acyl dehydratase
METDFRGKAITRQRGHWYEDFEIGREFTHHWGRTINEGDNSLFTTLTLHFNPLYFNKEFAVAHGHPREQVNPMLVFTTVWYVGQTRAKNRAFLGVTTDSLKPPVYPATR